MRPRLHHADRRYFQLFEAAAANVARGGALLHELLRTFPDGHDLGGQIRACEREGDRITRELVVLLNSTFVTPFDREDVYALASAVDAIVGHLEEAADEMALYGVRTVPDAAVAQAEAVAHACALLAEALTRLEGFRPVTDLLAALREQEREGDRLVRAALAALFRGDSDPLIVIRWKDIHEEIEAAANACEQAGLVLESIYLKGR